MFEKRSSLLTCLVGIVALALIPACIPYHKIIKSEFPQGTDHCINKAVVAKHLRSLSIYRQFETMAHFDALWLSDDMRTCYADLYAFRRGLRVEAYDAYLRRQLEENNHWVSIYLLADIRDYEHVSMSEKDTAWTLYLEADSGEKVKPESIKEVTLEPEIRKFFSFRFTRHKVAYLVKFPARSTDGKRFDRSVNQLLLHVSSPEKHASMRWDIEHDVEINGGHDREQAVSVSEEGTQDEDLFWA